MTELWTNDNVLTSNIREGTLLPNCQTLVFDMSTHRYRRCTRWSVGQRGGHFVCTAHRRSRTITLPIGDPEPSQD